MLRTATAPRRASSRARSVVRVRLEKAPACGCSVWMAMASLTSTSGSAVSVVEPTNTRGARIGPCASCEPLGGKRRLEDDIMRARSGRGIRHELYRPVFRIPRGLRRGVGLRRGLVQTSRGELPQHPGVRLVGGAKAGDAPPRLLGAPDRLSNTPRMASRSLRIGGAREVKRFASSPAGTIAVAGVRARDVEDRTVRIAQARPAVARQTTHLEGSALRSASSGRRRRQRGCDMAMRAGYHTIRRVVLERARS